MKYQRLRLKCDSSELDITESPSITVCDSTPTDHRPILYQLIEMLECHFIVQQCGRQL